MRSSAGIVAGLFLIGLVANCGGDDTTTNTPTGGTNTAGGEGGQGNVGNKNTGGTQNLSGTKNTSGTDAGGMPPMIECSVDKDCGAGAKCVDNACKKDDGETCTASAECQNTCIDGMCTGKLDDGQACTADTDCAHTCIDGMCAMPSDVGGDCDVAGEGGAGGAGGAPAVGPVAGNAGAGGAGEAPQNPDCKAPLQCVTGKCLTPDGEACTDNPDCINTCIDNKCAPKSPLDGPCGDLADCEDLGGTIKVVCDANKHVCKLDVTSSVRPTGSARRTNAIALAPTAACALARAPTRRANVNGRQRIRRAATTRPPTSTSRRRTPTAARAPTSAATVAAFRTTAAPAP